MKLDFAWMRRRRLEQEMKAEIEDHLTARAADLEKSGLQPEAARRRAAIEFGRGEKYQEETRAAAGTLGVETVIQDVRFGLRVLRKSPGFTVAAVLLLALGIGVNAALFSMVDWLLLRPLPVSHPEQLSYLLSSDLGGGHSIGFSYPNLTDIQAQTQPVFSAVAGFLPFQMDGLAVDGVASSFWTSYVSGNFFSLLGIHPALGRFIESTGSEEATAKPELVLSYAYWQARFGGRGDVLGKAVEVDGRAVRIIGVAPRGFQGPLAVVDTQGYLPFNLSSSTDFGLAGDFFHDRAAEGGIFILGRRRAGVSLEQAQPELQVVGQRLAHQYPKEDRWYGLYARQLTSEPPGANAGTQDPIALAADIFLGLSGLVLLLACVNIAGLMLARAVARGPEMAVRAALGAGRGRMMRQMLIESLLLAGLGGAGGLLLGLAACRGLNALPLGGFLPVALGLGLNGRVFAFTAALVLGAGVAVGLIPAWQASRQAPATVLHAGVRSVLRARTRLRSALIVAEVGGSLMLLIAAGLFVRSLAKVQELDLGFAPEGVENFTLNTHGAGYNDTRGAEFYRTLLAKTSAIPGVQAASLAVSAPFGNFTFGATVTIPGYAAPPQHPLSVGFNAVTPGYFATMGIHLLRGRDFTPADNSNATGVAIVNQTMARKYWPRSDALGRTYTMTEGAKAATVLVVGVAADSRTDTLAGPIEPYMYLPLAQHYKTLAVLQIRATGDRAALVRAVRATIAATGSGVPLLDVQSMSDGLRSINGLLIYKLGAGLAGTLGLLGLLMAIIGIYGVIAYSASQRTREVGLRLALGARRDQILGLMLRQGLVMTGIGLALGLVLATGLSRGLASMLTGVGPFDPVTYIASALLLASVATAASLIPAVQALRTDPAEALRCE